jgi:hypothetical protein
MAMNKSSTPRNGMKFPVANPCAKATSGTGISRVFASHATRPAALLQPTIYKTI